MGPSRPGPGPPKVHSNNCYRDMLPEVQSGKSEILRRLGYIAYGVLSCDDMWIVEGNLEMKHPAYSL